MKRGRPQKSQEDINEILRIFEENKANVVVNGKLPSRNDPIWNDLCLQSNNLFSSLSFFTMASKDYYNIKHILGIDKPPQVPTLFEVENESSPESKVSSDSEIDSTAPEDIKFDIILSYEEYISLNKHTTTYKRNDKFEKKNKVRKLESREYTTFEPRHWSHIISKKIEVKLCEHGNYCAIIFKRNKIFITCESKFAEFHGYCKECKGKLFGYIESPPTEDEDIMVNFTLTNFSPHSKTSFKRPLSGRSRIELGEHLVRTNIAPSHYRKILASRDMVGHCDVPSWIPNLSTLRVAKNEQVKAGRYHDDPVYSICQMKVDPSMKGAIQNIGLDPFFVYIWTNTQIFVYNRYCSTEYAKLCIDATGGVVRKLTKITGEKSKHIFFYDCTVMSKTSKKDNQYSVCNFLSESQNAVSIYSWLAHWIRAGAVIPQEVVTDMSLALMYAVTLAFTNSKSLEQYIHNCFKAVIEHDPFNEKCFIRLDVAHFVKLVSQWPSLKKQHRLTRQFYLRAIGQLIQSTTIEDIENIIKAICTVALSDTEGTGLLTGTPTTCEIRKNWLKRRLASGSIEILLSVQEDNNDSQHNTNDFLKDNNNLSYFGNWVRFIAEDCKKLVNTEVEEGDRGNQQCLPAFIEDLTKISKYLPLFTGVMTQYFPSANIIGSSATVESNINDIKNRIFGNVKLPMRVDDFLKNFILSADGASKLAESEMNEIDQSNNKGPDQQVRQQQQDVDINYYLDIEGKSVQDVFCPSCQLKQNFTDSCSNCQKGVHRNKLCASEIENNTIVCLKCSRLEQNSFENWRGLASETPKRRPRHSYLEPCSELLKVDYTNLRKVISIGLLRNGHLIDLLPIKISKTLSVTLSNTCAFDSMVQLMASGVCDSETFKQLMLSNTECIKIAEIVNDLVKHGVTKRTYRLRAEILTKIFDTHTNPCGILSLSVETEVGNLLPKLDFHYCAMKRIECTECLFLEVKFLCSVEICVSDGDFNFSELQELTIFSPFRDCSQSNCNGKLKKKNDFSLTHIFIEPLNMETKTFELYTSLDSIPKIINIDGNTYILRGVIGYVGPKKGIGHFICYCFRHNNKWEEFDDRNTKSQPCSGKKDVRIQMLLYTL